MTDRDLLTEAGKWPCPACGELTDYPHTPIDHPHLLRGHRMVPAPVKKVGPHPITEAGRRHALLAGGNPERRGIVGRAVCAIEAEARLAVLMTLREWIAMHRGHVTLVEIEAEIDRLMAENSGG
jgi:hypothetical protein